MILIGLTPLMRQEAEKRFAGAFRAWHAEMKAGRWKEMAELLRYFPKARLLGCDEAHFPLAADGAGIRAAILFHPGVLRLLRIAPAPAADRECNLSHPESKHEHQPTL